MSRLCFRIKISIFLVAALSSLLAKGADFSATILFVGSRDQIPESLALRREYFYTLLDYQKELVKGFSGYISLLYRGRGFEFDLKDRVYTDIMRNDFFSRSVVIQDAGTLILRNGQFSIDELYAYQRMIRESSEIFSEIFQ